MGQHRVRVNRINSYGPTDQVGSYVEGLRRAFPSEEPERVLLEASSYLTENGNDIRALARMPGRRGQLGRGLAEAAGINLEE